MAPFLKSCGVKTSRWTALLNTLKRKKFLVVVEGISMEILAPQQLKKYPIGAVIGTLKRFMCRQFSEYLARRYSAYGEPSREFGGIPPIIEPVTCLLIGLRMSCSKVVLQMLKACGTTTNKRCLRWRRHPSRAAKVCCKNCQRFSPILRNPYRFG